MRFNILVQILILLCSGILSQPVWAEEIDSQSKLATASVTESIPVPEYNGPKIRVNVAARKLYLYDHGDKLVKTYDVAVGSGRFPTPLGSREMDQIVWNPWWLPPPSEWAKNDKPTPPGPRNPLGPVKMRLGSAILIHGTNKPQSVGHAASHGCMRMRSEEAPELAWYIQKRSSSQGDENLRAGYDKQRGRSFYVMLSQNVPVEIMYDVAEVENGQVHVYQDVYGRVRDKLGAVRAKLESSGVDIADLDFKVIEDKIREAKNREDLVFEVASLMVNPRDRERYLAKLLKDQKGDSKLASALMETTGAQ